MREDLLSAIRHAADRIELATGCEPDEVALTTAVREYLRRGATYAVGDVPAASIDRLFGMPVVVDDSIPADPGFEVRRARR